MFPIKVRVILIFGTSIGVHKKPLRLSTNLYNLVYFDRRDQFNLSMGLSDTWSIMVKEVNIIVHSIEVRYL